MGMAHQRYQACRVPRELGLGSPASQAASGHGHTSTNTCLGHMGYRRCCTATIRAESTEEALSEHTVSQVYY